MFPFVFILSRRFGPLQHVHWLAGGLSEYELCKCAGSGAPLVQALDPRVCDWQVPGHPALQGPLGVG